MTARSAHPVALAMAMAAVAVPMADLVAAMVPAMMIAVAIAVVPILRHRRHAEAGERDRGGRGQFEKLHTLLSLHIVTPAPAPHRRRTEARSMARPEAVKPANKLTRRD